MDPNYNYSNTTNTGLQDMNTQALITHITKTLDDNKAQDIRTIDVSHLTDVTDHMIICSGTSSRHVNSLAD
jgi:ribosome-associated protein